jgi:hypothetical protein
MTSNKFGLRPPSDTRHLQKYSLTAQTYPDKPTPVVQGFAWHAGFNAENLIQRDGSYWFPKPAAWGAEQGGHATVLKPVGVRDTPYWRRFYDQTRNSCVAHSSCRAMSLLNREVYDPEPLYDLCLKTDEFPGERDEGTSVRAAMEILRTAGPWDRKGKQDAADGISAYLWAPDMNAIARCLSPADNGAMVLNRGWALLVNSWGPGYPYVRVELDYLNTLIFESGWRDAAVMVDR